VGVIKQGTFTAQDSEAEKTIGEVYLIKYQAPEHIHPAAEQGWPEEERDTFVGIPLHPSASFIVAKSTSFPVSLYPIELEQDSGFKWELSVRATLEPGLSDGWMPFCVRENE
jgi:hypothetical protein